MESIFEDICWVFHAEEEQLSLILTSQGSREQGIFSEFVMVVVQGTVSFPGLRWLPLLRNQHNHFWRQLAHKHFTASKVL